jgi:hypothetical protein
MWASRRPGQPHSFRVNSFVHSSRSGCGPWGVHGEFGLAWHFKRLKSEARILCARAHRGPGWLPAARR